MIYTFIESHEGRWSVEMMCRVLEISRSSYYCWKKSPINKRMEHSNQKDKHIRNAYFEAQGRYGSPKISKELQEQGIQVSRRTVSKRMKQIGLRSKLSRKYTVTTDSSHKEPVAENILNRDFTADSPASKWVSNITYLPTNEGFLYLTTIIDLFDRKVIGWAISEGMSTQETVLAAIGKAMKNRTANAQLIFHSDRGVQYASKATVNVLKSYDVVQSMSREGNCWDNAVAESFFKSLKTELIYGNKLSSKKEMRLKIFEYIEIWYNRNRRYSFLNSLTMEEFWKKYEYTNNNLNPAA